MHSPLTPRSQQGQRSLATTARRLASYPLLLVLTLSLSARAQSTPYTQGLPTVGNGNSTSSPAPSLMLIDATQFGTATDDMCTKIADACGKLTASAPPQPYPFGVTIDARGFTGDQVCKASNATTMLTTCVTQNNNNPPPPTLQLGGGFCSAQSTSTSTGPAAGRAATTYTQPVTDPALRPSSYPTVFGESRA